MTDKERRSFMLSNRELGELMCGIGLESFCDNRPNSIRLLETAKMCLALRIPPTMKKIHEWHEQLKSRKVGL